MYGPLDATNGESEVAEPTDLAEATDLIRTLAERVERLRASDRRRAETLATVSHELRTPLTSIIGYSELLLEGMAGPLTADQRSHVHTIHEKGEELLTLLTCLLELARLESGGVAIHKVPLDLAGLLAGVAASFLPHALRKGVEVAVRCGEGLPGAFGDPIRLRQVFVNLVDNALKFTPAGGSVSLSAAPRAGGAVVVRVADTGIGIPPAHRQRVFDAFYQVDTSSNRKHAGVGLGLAIVRGIVDAHGGTIVVESAQPQGTEVIVTLPVAPPGSVIPPSPATGGAP